jgi:hypothetical protein
LAQLTDLCCKWFQQAKKNRQEIPAGMVLTIKPDYLSFTSSKSTSVTSSFPAPFWFAWPGSEPG